MDSDRPDDLAGLSLLADPARRTLYRFVASSADPVSREQAATATAMPLHTVKFHLDRLAAEGLLEVEYRRLTGRTGPGAGRPAKLYRRASGELAVSVPERHYDLAGDLLAGGIDRAASDGVPVEEGVRRVAREAGLRTAADAPAGTGADEADEAVRLLTTLERQGYEPRQDEAEICLANCPFDRLATRHTALVCGMNLAFVEGVVDGLDVMSWPPRLSPRAGRCCVVIDG